MPNNIEGAPAPDSMEAKAIAELEKEGNVIEGKEPAPVVEVPKEPAPKEEPKEVPPVKEEPKPDRSPQMVETWKLKVAEDQKNALAKQVADLQTKYDELSKKGPVEQAKKDEITDDIEAVIKEAEAAGTDGTFLRKLATSIINKTKPSGDVEKTLKSLQEERELEKQLNSYQTEFDTDVLPLVKEYNLSGDALSKLKNELKDIAFSETYAKVPLKEIFRIKEEGFGLKTPKKSSEGKGVKVRGSDTIDIENLDEEGLKNLTPEQVEKFVQAKNSTDNGVWNTNRK